MTEVSSGCTTRLGRVVVSFPCAITIMSTCETEAQVTAARIRPTTLYSVRRAMRGGVRSSTSIASDWNCETTADLGRGDARNNNRRRRSTLLGAGTFTTFGLSGWLLAGVMRSALFVGSRDAG